MPNLRLIGWTLAALSVVVLALSVPAMARRVGDYNASGAVPDFRFQPTLARKFKAHGRDVAIIDAATQVGGQPHSAVRLVYGDRELLIPIEAPTVKDIPDLGLYAEWLVPMIVSRIDRTQGRPQPTDERIVIVKRNTAAGYDPATWGTVRRADWTFEFYELKPDGSIERSDFRWPRSARSEKRLKEHGADPIQAPDGKALPNPEAPLLSIPPLQERTWQFGAALHVIPKLNVPSYRFNNTAMEAMGWTLPAAGFAVLGLLAGLGLAFAPRRRPT